MAKGYDVNKKVQGIRDIARETGLSIATVSRAINGVSTVGKENRERVLRACQELDYLPNPAARALSTRKSKTIASIIPTIENSVYAKFLAAIEKSLSDHGYSLVISVSSNEGEEEITSARKLLGMGADAFILSGAAHAQSLLDLLQRRNVPHVFTSVWEAESTTPVIGYDNARISERALHYLHSKGHECIAIVHGPTLGNDRVSARIAGAHRATLNGPSIVFYETPLTVAGGKSAVPNILDSAATAVLCFSDVIALGVYFALMEHNLSVPDDMSVMGFDNLDWSRDATPPLTTIDLPAGRMGERVANQLVDYLENGTAIASEVLAANIIERASVKDISDP
ncbi:MAG: LacI family DNA-binding transcriptional regulator [Pseudomonadota bacterium]